MILGYKAVAVNLSDLAAMGAEPCWLTLSLTLLELQHDWLAAFSRGLHALADLFSVSLIGGDLCRGPLSITIQAHGLIPKGQATTCGGARPGDRIYVTGRLGAAGLALKIIQREIVSDGDYSLEYQRLYRPYPRVAAGILLREAVSSMTDISDGLQADLGKILAKSAVGAQVNLDKLPLSENLNKLPIETSWQLALTAGDDYELCFTLPRDHPQSLLSALAALCPVSEIGCITQETTFTLLRPDGTVFAIDELGYQHF